MDPSEMQNQLMMGDMNQVLGAMAAMGLHNMNNDEEDPELAAAIAASLQEM